MTTPKRGGILSRLPHTQPRKSAALDSMRLDLHDIAPCLHLRVSDRAKRMALRLDAKTGKIHLVIPARASLKKALEFARTHQEWIDRQAADFPEPVILKNGSVLPVLGQDRVVRIIYVEGLKRTSIRLEEKEIIVITNKEDPTGRIIRFLKNLARTEITRITMEKSSLINKVHGTLYIRDTTSRWGSCSQEGNLSFSWRLVLAPLESLDYVVAHEVAHLMHMDHGPKFWALCEKLSTDFSTGHNWMKTQGHSLMRYC